MPITTQRGRILWALAGGIALGVAYTASPLTCLLAAATPLLIRSAGRGLPDAERRVLTGILIAAVATRVLVLGAQFVAGLSAHNSLSVGSLSGDEAYNLARALRTRDVWLGVAASRYDYFVVFDDYGRSSYLTLLSWLQVLFGPTPFSARMLNTGLFMAGAVVLFRLFLRSFGAAPAFGGLVVLLFLPSLFHASIMLLKESAYLLATAALLGAIVQLTRTRTIRHAAVAILILGISLWLLEDLRREGLVLAVSGLGLGLALYAIVAMPWRAAAAGLVLVVAMTAAGIVPTALDRTIRAVETTAKIHSGHVFTVGHSYQLLDPGFYTKPSPASSSSIVLTPDHAVRFVLRAAISFVVTPLPWEMRSSRELAFIPEQLIWYGLVALMPAGLIAGWRRDPILTCLFAGYAATIAAVVAVTTGNVGTLLRLRGLVTPLICWFSVLGLCALLEAAARRRDRLQTATRSHSNGHQAAEELA